MIDSIHPDLRRRGGFALVIALGLMAFVLILILSVSTLVQVESRSSNAAKNMELAKSNALLGLRIAVGELQVHAGLDQRFTATSAITGASTNANITGVWEEGADSPLTWLVSGNCSADPLAVTPSALPNPATDAAADEVFLVDQGSALYPGDRIKVAKERISAEEAAGHYAYWIGDGGRSRLE